MPNLLEAIRAARPLPRDAEIGTWVARFSGERQLTKWHLVDSDVAERVITRCGRDMEQRSERGILLAGDGPDRCKVCR